MSEESQEEKTKKKHVPLTVEKRRRAVTECMRMGLTSPAVIRNRINKDFKSKTQKKTIKDDIDVLRADAENWFLGIKRDKNGLIIIKADIASGYRRLGQLNILVDELLEAYPPNAYAVAAIQGQISKMMEVIHNSIGSFTAITEKKQATENSKWGRPVTPPTETSQAVTK